MSWRRMNHPKHVSKSRSLPHIYFVSSPYTRKDSPSSPVTSTPWERSKAARTLRRLQATQRSDSHTVQCSQARPLADCVYIQKAEAANQKVAAENAKKAIAEDQGWSKGAKSNAKKCVPSPAPKLH